MPQNNASENKSFGSTVAIIIIILVLAAGGYYVWKNYLGAQKTAPVGNTETSVDDLEASLGAIDVGTVSDLDNLENQF